MKSWQQAAFAAATTCSWVSTANQLANIDYTSIDSQIQIIKDYVASRPELELEEIFIDRAKSAKNMNRPAIKDMVRRIKAGGISYVVSYRLDRITREKFSYYEFERMLVSSHRQT